MARKGKRSAGVLASTNPMVPQCASIEDSLCILTSTIKLTRSMPMRIRYYQQPLLPLPQPGFAAIGDWMVWPPRLQI
eukprot:5028486-Amphidinium_carterae.1